jgi:hypothetical protein
MLGVERRPGMNVRGLLILLSYVIVILLVCMGWLGCTPAPKRVVVDSPRLAFALVFLGVCAVFCSSIGGTCLVKASRRKKD